jgi:3-oxoacyl-[acyl-carrier-protein] synthase-3
VNATIRGLGAWFPETVRHNDEWPAAFHRELGTRNTRDISRIEPAADEIGAIMMRHAQKTAGDPFRGTVRRHVAPTSIAPSEAESLAAERALADAGVDPREVDLVLSHSLVPDRLTPPNAPLVALKTGCTRAAAFGLDAVCASAVAQLVLGSAMIESGRARFVLAVQSHLVFRTLDLLEPSSVFLGDGATAMVLGPAREGRGLLAHVARADGSFHGAVTWTREGEPGPWYEGGRVHPGSADREAVKRMSGQLLHLGVETCRELFDRGRIRAQEIAALASIQPTSWYTAALAEALGMREDCVPNTYPRVAHIGAAGVVANLLEARERGLLADGALVALYAHGAGANRTGALLRWG